MCKGKPKWLPWRLVAHFCDAALCGHLTMAAHPDTAARSSKMQGLMYCSGFDLSIAVSSEASADRDTEGLSELVAEMFQSRFAGEDMEPPRLLLRRGFFIARGRIEPQRLSIKTDEQAPLGHPCNDTFVLRLSETGPSQSALGPVEFEIAITQSGTKVAPRHTGKWSHSVSGHKVALHGPGGIAIDFESHRGYAD
jgi:hypothetical protein